MVFAIFGIICLLGVLFIRTRVPETKGHTLEEIEQQGVVKENDNKNKSIKSSAINNY